MATLNIVTRSQWGARHGRGGTNVTPRNGGCAGHYNGGAISRGDHANCAARVRSIEQFHVGGNGWAGIAYNYLICHHGIVFEGRGWGRRSAAQGTNPGNQNYLAFMFLMGGSQTLNAAMRTAGRLLVLHLRSRGAGTQVRPHSFFTSTSCPGNSGRAWINSGIPGGGVDLPDPGNGGGAPRSVASIQRAVNGLGYTPPLDVDGADGPLTRSGVRWLQGIVGASVDGVWGPETEHRYTAYMEDEVPERNRYTWHDQTPVPLRKGEWVQMRYGARGGDDDAAPFYSLAGVSSRPMMYQVAAGWRITGLEPGAEYQTRLALYDPPSSSGEAWQRARALRTREHKHALGDAFNVHYDQGHVNAEQRVRLEILIHTDSPDAAVINGSCDTFYWPQ